MVSIRKLYSSLLQINVLFIAHLKNNDTKSSEIGNDISFVNRTRNFYLQKNKLHEMSHLTKCRILFQKIWYHYFSNAQFRNNYFVPDLKQKNCTHIAILKIIEMSIKGRITQVRSIGKYFYCT